MEVVGGHLHGYDLLGFDVDGEVELHVPLPLPMFPLHPASGPVHLDLGGVDGYGDGLVRLLQRLVGVGVQRQDALPQARVIARRKLGYELVEAAGEPLELAVGHPVEVPYSGEELDVGVGEAVGAVLLAPVHGLQLLRVVLHEAEFEDELSPSDEAFVCFSPIYGQKILLT